MTTIILTGAGSGGHITPILAVAAELKRLKTDIKLIYIGQKGDPMAAMPSRHKYIDEVYVIRAGKFRRYHGEGLKQLTDIPTMLKNIRDVLFVLIGLLQSWKLLRRLRPKVIFIKGGYVGVPVGLAAASLKIPFITHDSDAVPGLANKIIAKWASKHAVALPPEAYYYPRNKTVMTGIPLRREFVPVNTKIQQDYRAQLKIPSKSQVLFVVGGGLGAERINLAVAEVIPHLLAEFEELYVLHGVGQANETAMNDIYDKKLSEAERGRLKVYGFIDDLYKYSGAADIIISRAGATNLAEFAVQGKACIIIPSPFLAAGHQLKNGIFLDQQGAAVIIDETELQEDPNRLAAKVSDLLKKPENRRSLGSKMSKLAHPHASSELARLILDEL
ncbi:MAG TPA: UDP-N-acetylglucosamine--N-acetylmuramyl-(pentapeptide) pyrophosphoryl-undecaprenol N-acetylglucosamine transferase [Candidatus Saccharimonadales bacterium]|nr:UDP-N-acetylglucosamine--N-acetylmuramyl-(pentapeptide) pyrophosphoryl-undecaprenol N-acetylglucosamine transferase [Candidatus Saccharimonadales bacterium]